MVTFTIEPNTTEIVFVKINVTPNDFKKYAGTINLKLNNTFLSKTPLSINIFFK